MSAWDIAGAVVWTPLAVLNTWALVRLRKTVDVQSAIGGVSFSAVFTFVAVFCIARLCGAHA